MKIKNNKLKSFLLVSLLSVPALAMAESSMSRDEYEDIQQEYINSLAWECKIDNDSYYVHKYMVEESKVKTVFKYDGITICEDDKAVSLCGYEHDPVRGYKYKIGLVVNNARDGVISRVCRLDPSLIVQYLDSDYPGNDKK